MLAQRMKDLTPAELKSAHEKFLGAMEAKPAR
jgi:hypothetical protein